MATPCNTPRIMFPLEFTAPPEQPAHPVRNTDDAPDVLEAVEEEPEANLRAIGTGPQPIDEQMEDELLKPRCYATFWNGCLRGMRIRHRPDEKFCPTCRKAVELQAEQVDLTAVINKSQGFRKWETKQAVEARLRVVERELPEKLQHKKWLAEQRGEVSHVSGVVVTVCSCKLRVVLGEDARAPPRKYLIGACFPGLRVRGRPSNGSSGSSGVVVEVVSH